MKKSHSILAAIIMGTAALGGLAPAHAAAKADFNYAQVLALIENSGGDSKAVTSKIVGKLLGMHLQRIGERVLMVNPKDGVFFVCEKGDADFKGGDVVLKMARFVSSDDTEPTVFLESCATAP